MRLFDYIMRWMEENLELPLYTVEMARVQIQGREEEEERTVYDKKLALE